MQQECDFMISKNTWTLTNLPSHRKVVGYKWVFKVKTNLMEALTNTNLVFVAKGLHQQYGLDFHETLSHIVKPTTIKVILTLALILTYMWDVQQVDINNVFLNGALQE